MHAVPMQRNDTCAAGGCRKLRTPSVTLSLIDTKRVAWMLTDAHADATGIYKGKRVCADGRVRCGHACSMCKDEPRASTFV